MPIPKDPVKAELWRKRQSDSHKGQSRKQTEETKRKLREMRIGNKNPFFHKMHTPEMRKHLSITHMGERNVNYGKPLSESARLKLSAYTGDKTSNWKGGRSSLLQLIRANAKYTEWRLKVLTRDGYRDWFSGVKGTNETMSAHHIVSLNRLIKQYNIKTIEDAQACGALWDVNNGVSMLKPNHRAYHVMWGNF